MAKIKFELNGIEQLKQRLMEKKAMLEIDLEMRLLHLAEDAVKHAKEHKGYKDRTGNLKNSISFALYKDGECVNIRLGEGDENAAPAFIESKLKEYAAEVVKPKGYSLVIVAPMEYAKHVENKGYNVLYLTRYFVIDGMKDALKEALDALE